MKDHTTSLECRDPYFVPLHSASWQVIQAPQDYQKDESPKFIKEK